MIFLWVLAKLASNPRFGHVLHKHNKLGIHWVLANYWIDTPTSNPRFGWVLHKHNKLGIHWRLPIQCFSQHGWLSRSIQTLAPFNIQWTLTLLIWNRALSFCAFSRWNIPHVIWPFSKSSSLYILFINAQCSHANISCSFPFMQFQDLFKDQSSKLWITPPCTSTQQYKPHHNIGMWRWMFHNCKCFF